MQVFLNGKNIHFNSSKRAVLHNIEIAYCNNGPGCFMSNRIALARKNIIKPSLFLRETKKKRNEALPS
jgi:hypothetical protein